ncbi:MAG: adenylate cyclase, partial [Firmicutes bacterium]|nr:adenylate cyclase [Bacillota bacterium]
MNINNTEIERKFLVDRLPGGLDKYKCLNICQGYISTDPTIRLRQCDDKYILTVKGAAHNNGLDRAEFELPLTKEQFVKLWEKTETG